MALDFLTENAIIYVLIAWVVILIVAKSLKLEKHGFTIKAYSLTYKNSQVQSVLSKMLTRTRRGIRVFADVSVIAGFLMMGFAFWFLISNISNFFVEPTEFAELTVLIPGVTLTSAFSYFVFSVIYSNSSCGSRRRSWYSCLFRKNKRSRLEDLQFSLHYLQDLWNQTKRNLIMQKKYPGLES